VKEFQELDAFRSCRTAAIVEHLLLFQPQVQAIFTYLDADSDCGLRSPNAPGPLAARLVEAVW
jgi:hypothetical protein